MATQAMKNGRTTLYEGFASNSEQKGLETWECIKVAQSVYNY